MAEPQLNAAVERLNRALATLENATDALSHRAHRLHSSTEPSQRENRLREEVSAVIAELDALLERPHG